jgi:tRNA U55 pseudouridine synthase TruB
MNDFEKDEVIEKFLSENHQLPVQYSAKKQFNYAIELANHFGLYDAADIIRKKTF